MAHYGPARSNERAVSELFKRQPRTRAKQEPRKQPKTAKKGKQQRGFSSAVGGFGCGSRDGDGTDVVARGWGQLLEILEAAFEFESWRFSPKPKRALLLSVRIVRHEGKTQKHKKIHIWKLAPRAGAHHEMKYECNAEQLKKMNKCALALNYFKLEHVKRILIEPAAASAVAVAAAADHEMRF